MLAPPTCLERVVSRRRQSRLLLAVLAGATLFFIAITFSPWASGFADAPDRGPGDIALYSAEVARMQDGATYYEAAEAELRARGYPTRSIFNWRMPLPTSLIAWMPNLLTAKFVLGLLGLLLIGLAFRMLAEEGSAGEGLLGVLLLVGALLPCLLGELLVLPELWSGVLLALSVVCFGNGFRAWGVLAGLAALWLRELAAPYVIVCLALALHERRWRELAGWSAGLAAYAVFLAVHVSQVLPRISPNDTAHAAGWIQFGGAGFLISTVQMNAYLLVLPQWVTATYLGAALLGCSQWRSPAGARVGFTVGAYAVAFTIAGHDFNQYWGSMTAPLLCLAVSRAPRSLSELLAAARSPNSESIAVQV